MEGPEARAMGCELKPLYAALSDASEPKTKLAPILRYVRYAVDATPSRSDGATRITPPSIQK